jgi:hypothetical protein
MDRHRQRPGVETLEALVPLSVVVGGGHGAAVVARNTIALGGSVRGAYLVTNPIPDTGSTYRFGVAGKLNPVGQTGDSGQIQTPGFIANGHAEGTMTISAPRGNIKLQLTGPSQPGFSALPGTVDYTITGGTKSYRTAQGSGTIAVTLNSSVFSNRFGLITLTFHAGTSGST